MGETFEEEPHMVGKTAENFENIENPKVDQKRAPTPEADAVFHTKQKRHRKQPR